MYDRQHGSLADPTAASTIATMPAANITLIALFKAAPPRPIP